MNPRFKQLARLVLRHEGLLIALLAVSGGCSRATAPSPPIAVKVKTLRQEVVTSATRFSATVQPRQSVDLAFKVPGTVERLYVVEMPHAVRDVQEGDNLQRGDLIAALAPQDYQRALDRARANLAAAAETITRARAARDFARRERDRLERLSQDGSVSQTERDDAQSQLDIAEAELAAAIQAHAAADQMLQQAEADRNECDLHVPIDNATVAQKRVEPQERVERNQTVFRVMDVTTVHVEFGVPDTLLGVAVSGEEATRLTLGDELRVYLDAFEGRTFSGRVSKIAPAADANTRTFAVEIMLDNPQRLIKPGMIATVCVGEERTAVLLPMTAIQRGAEPGEMAVYVIEQTRGPVAAHHRVQLGGVYNNQVEIKLADSEVGLGDQVAVTGAWRLHDGVAVRVLPREPDEWLP
jgi:multidrug efflux system membrane fusion protein